MRKWKAIFSVLTILFAAVGLLRLVSFDISTPIMFVFLGLSMIVNAKESYDKGSKGEAVCLGVMTVLLYAVTVYNLISRVL